MTLTLTSLRNTGCRGRPCLLTMLYKCPWASESSLPPSLCPRGRWAPSLDRAAVGVSFLRSFLMKRQKLSHNLTTIINSSPLGSPGSLLNTAEAFCILKSLSVSFSWSSYFLSFSNFPKEKPAQQMISSTPSNHPSIHGILVCASLSTQTTMINIIKDFRVNGPVHWLLSIDFYQRHAPHLRRWPFLQECSILRR